jgi:hypothetical protein
MSKPEIRRGRFRSDSLTLSLAQLYGLAQVPPRQARDLALSHLSAGSASKEPKVQIRREKTLFGWLYRIYIEDTYMGAGLTVGSARARAKRMLVIYANENGGIHQ